jgi:hypothetical protein
MKNNINFINLYKLNRNADLCWSDFFRKPVHLSLNILTQQKKVAVVEDKELGLVIEVPYGPSILKKAEIISEYEIQFLYEDGSSRISKILM